MNEGNEGEEEEEDDELANIARPPAEPLSPQPSSSQSDQPTAAIGFTPLPSNHNDIIILYKSFITKIHHSN